MSEDAVSNKRAVGILGVPLDLGAGRRGTDMGPSALRIAGMAARIENLGRTVEDHGYVAVAAPETRTPGDERLRFGKEILRTCTRVRDRVKAILTGDAFPLVIGGDHSMAMGTVAGTKAWANGPIGVLWIDAHADLNTHETSPSGNVHGMPLAVILGKGDPSLLSLSPSGPMAKPEHTVILGLRDVDPGEKKRIRKLGITVYSMKELDERGANACIREAIERVTKDTVGFHLSFDMDSIDPEIAPGVGTPVPGGLTYREAHLACELAAESGGMLSMDLVEVNPILDDKNRTAQMAVELIQSALGKTIY